MKTSHVETGSNSQGNSPSLATVLSTLNWGGNSDSYNGKLEDVSAAPAAGTGTPAAGAGSPPAGAGNGQGSPTDGGTGGAPAAGAAAVPDANAENLRTLRTNYETLKPWETVSKAVKDPALALSAFQSHQKMYTSGLEMAKALGYTEESYKAAFDDDAVDTLSHLRAEHAKANPDAAGAERIRKAAEDAARTATKPITEHLNRQQTEVAMAKYDGEFSRLITDDKLGFGKDVAPEVREAMEDIVNQMMPDNVLAEIKASGKVSGIQATFDQAKAHLIKVVNAYNGMLAKSAAANNGGGAGRTIPNRAAASNGGDKPLTIDDIINDPSANLPGLKSGAYN